YAGWVNKRFNNLRNLYRKLLTSTLTYRPVTLTMAVIVVLCAGPFFMFTAKELAPKEDQGVIFTIVQGPPTATIDQMARYSGQAYDILKGIKETDNTFQITQPGSGFGGVVVKPWGSRTRTT